MRTTISLPSLAKTEAGNTIRVNGTSYGHIRRACTSHRPASEESARIESGAGRSRSNSAAQTSSSGALERNGQGQTRRTLGCDGSFSAKFTGPTPQMAMMAGSLWPRTTPS
jgi:hypothetical protein